MSIKKIVEFTNRHMEEPLEDNKIYESIDDLRNITMEILETSPNKLWYILHNNINFKLFVEISENNKHMKSCRMYSWDNISSILKMNEIKIIKNDMEQHLI